MKRACALLWTAATFAAMLAAQHQLLACCGWKIADKADAERPPTQRSTPGSCVEAHADSADAASMPRVHRAASTRACSKRGMRLPAIVPTP